MARFNARNSTATFIFQINWDLNKKFFSSLLNIFKIYWILIKNKRITPGLRAAPQWQLVLSLSGFLECHLSPWPALLGEYSPVALNVPVFALSWVAVSLWKNPWFDFETSMPHYLLYICADICNQNTPQTTNENNQTSLNLLNPTRPFLRHGSVWRTNNELFMGLLLERLSSSFWQWNSS